MPQKKKVKHVCIHCGYYMFPNLVDKTYRIHKPNSGDELHIVTVPDVKVFTCVNCGREIMEASEAKRVEAYVQNTMNPPEN